MRQRDVVGWMNPWPIKFQSERQWRVRFVTLSQALKFKAYWHDERGRRFSARTVARRVRANWLNKDHQIGSMARVGHVQHRPVIMVAYGVIVDGNHTVLALERLKYRGPIMVLEAHDAE